MTRQKLLFVIVGVSLVVFLYFLSYVSEYSNAEVLRTPEKPLKNDTENKKTYYWPHPVKKTVGKTFLPLLLPLMLEFDIGTASTKIRGQIESEFFQLNSRLEQLEDIPNSISVSNSSKYLHKIMIVIEDLPLSLLFIHAESERYKLDINEDGVRLTASTFNGIIYGFETLYQSISLKKHPDGNIFPILPVPLSITDQPSFPWRGVLIDIARNYWTLQGLYKVVQVMSILKLNILHLHISDDHSFSIQSKVFPSLSIGNFHEKAVYTQEEISALVEFSQSRGIAIVPEISIPGHCGGWVNAEKIEMDLKGKVITQCPSFACKVGWSIPLFPSNKTFSVVKSILEEMIQLFPSSPYFHVGGDEVVSQCWAEDPDLINRNFSSILNSFYQITYDVVKNSGKIPVKWEDAGLSNYTRPKDELYQFWNPHEFKVLEKNAKEGDIIYSYGWYLNHNADPGRGCRSWGKCYYKAIPKLKGMRGVEMSAWEISEAHFTERNIWIRMIALSERFWTNIPVSVASEDRPAVLGDEKERLIEFCKRLEEEKLIPLGVCSKEYLASFYALEAEAKIEEIKRDTILCNRIGSLFSRNISVCETKNCKFNNVEILEEKAKGYRL
jgi:hexosaminidase